MQGSRRVRSRDDVAARVESGVRFGPPSLVGAEIELQCVDRAHPALRPPLDAVAAAVAAAGSLPGGSAVSTEPGGQLELSSVATSGASDLVAALEADLVHVSAALDRGGLLLRGIGADPLRAPVRLLRTPRYDCMEAHFAAGGRERAEAGAVMMCSTTALQVSVDAGTAGAGVQSATARWRRAHAIGPALLAAFACSPLLRGRPTGWRSARQRAWGVLDPSRTRPPAPELGPVEATTELALSALLLAVRDEAGVCRPAPPGLTFGEWMACGAPTVDDLDYHLTTLFPPVRLRGWLELRYLDMLPDPLWQVALATAAVLLDDDRAADEASAACAPTEGRWHQAARDGVADPLLCRAAAGCLGAAADGLRRAGAAPLAAAVEDFLERWTLRGRCPADDLVDAFAAGASAEALLLGTVEVAA